MGQVYRCSDQPPWPAGETREVTPEEGEYLRAFDGCFRFEEDPEPEPEVPEESDDAGRVFVAPDDLARAQSLTARVLVLEIQDGVHDRHLEALREGETRRSVRRAITKRIAAIGADEE